MANEQNSSKLMTWVIIAVVIAGVLFFLVRWLFPQVIEKFVSLLVGLLLVVTGLFLRRKK